MVESTEKTVRQVLYCEHNNNKRGKTATTGTTKMGKNMATEKFKALVHFIVHECQDNPSKLGAIRLNKTLWYTDVAAYRVAGASVTSEAYVKRKMGPVPSHILATIKDLQAENRLHVREPQGQFDSRKYISLESPDAGTLSEDEKTLARAVLSAVLGQTANAISEMTHDIIWDAAEDGEEIPLYATLASDLGAITDEVKNWAGGLLTEIKGQAA